MAAALFLYDNRFLSQTLWMAPTFGALAGFLVLKKKWPLSHKAALVNCALTAGFIALAQYVLASSNSASLSRQSRRGA